LCSRLSQPVKSKALALLAFCATCCLLAAQQPAAPSAGSMPVPLAEQLADFRKLQSQEANADLCLARLRAIGELRNDLAVDALMELVPQLQGAQQMAAVHAIYLASSTYAFQQLQGLASASHADAVRRQACRDLLLCGGLQLAFLRDQRLVSEENRMIRGEILRGLLERQVPHLRAKVLEAAKSKNSIYAAAGIYGIGVLQLESGRKLVEVAAQNNDLPLRRDALLALGALGGASSFSLLLKAYADEDNLMLRNPITAALQRADDLDEIAVMIARGLNFQPPELVRTCIDVIALAAPRFPELCNPVLQNALDHEDVRVREIALEGLVHAGSNAVIETLSKRLSSTDSDQIRDALWGLSQLNTLPTSVEARIVGFTLHADASVRMQAAAALRRFPHSDLAYQAVFSLLADEAWPVRSMAAESLQAFPRLESVARLVQLASEEQGRVREDAFHTLRLLTGKNFDARTENENKQSVVKNTYHGLDVPRDNLVFVLDISASMASRFDDDHTFLQYFVAALHDTINQLPVDTLFNVVLFSNDVQIWRDDLALASPDNIVAAQNFLAAATPGGGTNLHAALMASLGFAEVQTVFLLSDGEPTVGPVTAPAALLRALERRNRNRRVRFHTIAVGPSGADFLAALAAENGGQAIDRTADSR
jgi:HEAT repeat protein